MSARAYVSLGSNQGDRRALLGEARERLAVADGIRLTSTSAVIETAPVDVVDQPDFLNQVLGLDVDLDARGLLDACLSIERAMGRDREAGPRRGPRTIDLDVLLFDGRSIDEEGLVVPHPRLARRAFFLELLDQVGAPAAWLPAATVEATR